MNFDQVRYFLALAETLNFTRAAERSNVTQPTLTQAIRRLEEELGGPLVHRAGRHTRLTELGRSLRGHFEQIGNTRRDLKAVAEAMTSRGYVELNVGLMCTIGPRRIAGFLDAFQVRNPNVFLVLHNLNPRSIPEMLATGVLDAAFCTAAGVEDKRFCFNPLYVERMVVAFPTGHAFAGAEAVPVADAVKERYLDRLHCEFRNGLWSIAKTRDLDVNVVFSSEREDWIQAMIREGVGVSILPEFSLLQPAVDHRPVIDPSLQREVGLATAVPTSDSETLRDFIDGAQRFGWTHTRPD